MNFDHDFSRSPRQCQRRRETRFYCAQGCGAALAAVAVMALGWSIDGDSARLQASTLILQAELKQLQPRLAQVTEMESTITTQQEQLASQVAQAAQRAWAPHTLDALARISPVHIRLQQIVMRTDEAEIRGTASGQRQLQDLVESLRSSGLGQVRLQEMQQKDAQDALASPQLRYRFILILSNNTPVTAPVPAPAPSLPTKSDTAQVRRARRT